MGEDDVEVVGPGVDDVLGEANPEEVNLEEVNPEEANPEEANLKEDNILEYPLMGPEE